MLPPKGLNMLKLAIYKVLGGTIMEVPKEIPIDDSKLLDKLELLIEDLYQNHKIVVFKEKKMSKNKTKYTIIVQDIGQPTRDDKKEPKIVRKEKVIIKKELIKETGPVKPPKPEMADILSIGGY
jgi:hypothetical protein